MSELSQETLQDFSDQGADICENMGLNTKEHRALSRWHFRWFQAKTSKKVNNGKRNSHE